MTNVKSENGARPIMVEDETLGFGLWAVVQRHPVSVLLVMSVSLLLGGALYLRLPPSYEASADVLVETVPTTGLISSTGVEDSMPSENLETHALIICSPLILQQAVARHDNIKITGIVV